MQQREYLDTALWILSWGLLAAVIAFSLGPTPAAPFTYADKIFHAAAYFALTFCFLTSAVWSPLRSAPRIPFGAALIVLGAIALGASIEVMQGLSLDRTPDGWDALANSLGAGVAYLAWRGWRARTA